MRSFLACVILVTAAGGCAGDDSSTPLEPTIPPKQMRFSGGVQKGPFVLGSTIAISTVDAHGDPTGSVFDTQTTSDRGDFALETAYAGPVAIEGTGYYYDEVTNALSGAPQTLRAYFDTRKSGGAHVNLVTHLTHDRIHALLAGADLATATAQAETELRAGLGIGPAGFDPMEAGTSLDLLGGDTDANAYLLAVSAVVIQAAVTQAHGGPLDATLQELLDTIAADLADDGALSPALVAQLRAAQAALDPEAVKANLAARLAMIGGAAVVPDLDRMIDTDLDGVMNTADNCLAVANPTQVDGDHDGRGDECSADRILATSGDGQSASVTTTLAPFVAKVVDLGGRPVPGQMVAFTVVAGGGTLSAATAVSDAAGTASAQLTLGEAYGAYEVDATVVGMSLAPARFAATAGVGTYAAAQVGTSSAFDVTLADIDGDGRLDIVSAGGDANDQQVVTVLRNTTSAGAGSATFDAPLALFVGGGLGPVAVADLDGDGRADLVTTGADGTSALLQTAGSGGGLAFASPIAVGPGALSVALGDFDGDQRADVATSSLSSLTVVLKEPVGSAADPAFGSSWSASGAFVALVAGDLDGDTHTDLASVRRESAGGTSPEWLDLFVDTTAAGGAPSFAAATEVALPATAQVTGMALGDLDGDRRPDLALALQYPDHAAVRLLRNTTALGAPAVSFAAPVEVAVSFPIGRLALGDADGDHRLDLIVASSDGFGPALLLNTTAAVGDPLAFASELDAAAGGTAVAAALADLTGDGRGDLVCGASGGVSVLVAR